MPPSDALTPVAFQSLTGVSHETRARLEAYAELLVRWQARINLVGPATLPDLWRRHFLDSAQLRRHLPDGPIRLADLGSGAGFPGLVLAILGVGEVHLLESDARKSAFLREAARVTAAPVTVHNKRIESASGLEVDVITARALAPVVDLLRLGHPLLRSGGRMVLLKGRNVDGELTEATKYWKMNITKHPSDSDRDGAVVVVENIMPADPA